MFRRPLRAVLRPPLLFAAFLLLLWEETVWRWAKWLGAQVARIPVMAALERLVARLDARLVFLLFLIPIALLFPLKILALWLIATGRPVLGLAVVFVAKIVSTAVSARLYTIAEPRLMEIPTFVWMRGLTLRALKAAHAYLDASPGWQAAKRRVQAAKDAARALVRRARVLLRAQRGGVGFRFAAARRWLGRR